MTKSRHGILKSAVEPAQPDLETSDLSPQEHEVDRYSHSMFATFRFVGIAAGLLYIMQWVIAAISTSTSENSSTPKIPYPEADTGAAGVAVTLLITSAIAVQIFLRLPRDPERFTENDAVSHRQFWGPVANLIAVGSAFLVPYVIVDSLISAVETGVLNLAQAIGIPLVAVIALVFASDAVTIVSEEAQHPRYRQMVRGARLASLHRTKSQINGVPRKHPVPAFILYSLVVGSLIVGAGSWIVWALFEQPSLTIAFVILTSLSTGGMTLVCTQAVTAALRGRILDSIFQVILPVLAITLVSLQSIMIASPYISRPSIPESYIPALAYGILVTVPPFASVGILATIRIPRKFTSPMVDLSRHQLDKLIERYKMESPESPSGGETWRLLSGCAIALSPFPFVSLFLAVGATWHRSSSPQKTKGLFVTGWIFAIAFTIGEIAAILLVAFYGPELGWFKLCESASKC
ncbi:hypothetical protein [Brevibacterium zhoupengii]|uniref:hypothetical protein n=1 Tax=Brevibacterium zhoupengii TaxID=2898795 RepID=UPI001F08EDCB|nr:hypothetical protein [Brevibacterium zhoupengii]